MTEINSISSLVSMTGNFAMFGTTSMFRSTRESDMQHLPKAARNGAVRGRCPHSVGSDDTKRRPNVKGGGDSSMTVGEHK